MINRAYMVGNLTRDAEHRVTQSGMGVCRFTIAVNEWRKDQEAKAHYFDCVLFRGADKLLPYLTKGRRVAVESTPTYSKWEKDGQSRSRVEFRVESIEFLDSGKRESKSEPEPLSDDDIPF